MKKLGWLPILLCGSAVAQNAAWKFAVSGDSRNCGDIVMPAIASGVRNSGSEFYWHLGDFRAIYAFDEDMVPPASLGLPSRPLNIIGYLNAAWPDFIAHQIVPFGDLPVFLAPGNHETIPPVTRQDYLAQFADWLATPAIRTQRLKDDPKDHKLRTYYHWINHGVDFISLDNASSDQFDTAQLNWFHSVINRAEASAEVRTIVVGMHAALPGSVGYDHDMSESAQGDKSGREVYEALWHARNSAHKRVYLLASHSHFFMEDVYRTDIWKDKVLPGWIVGTAGAVRRPLPAATGSDRKALANVYGYLIGSVTNDGSVSFSFQQLTVEDLLRANQGRLPDLLVNWCFDHNRQ